MAADRHAEETGLSRVPPAVTSALPRVLVVDDEDILRELARAVLEREGFAVSEASEGQEAIALIEAGSARFDLVVLDLTMPGLSGEETFAAIRARAPDLPVLIATGHDPSIAAAALLVEPRTTSIRKPFLVRTLVERVRSALVA